MKYFIYLYIHKSFIFYKYFYNTFIFYKYFPMQLIVQLDTSEITQIRYLNLKI